MICFSISLWTSGLDKTIVQDLGLNFVTWLCPIFRTLVNTLKPWFRSIGFLMCIMLWVVVSWVVWHRSGGSDTQFASSLHETEGTFTEYLRFTTERGLKELGDRHHLETDVRLPADKASYRTWGLPCHNCLQTLDNPIILNFNLSDSSPAYVFSRRFSVLMRSFISRHPYLCWRLLVPLPLHHYDNATTFPKFRCNTFL